MIIDFEANDLIIACSSGSNQNAAIALIRLSGKFTLDSFQSFFSSDLKKIKIQKNFLTNILDRGNIVDQVVACYYEAPKSFTGENILELSVHGNQLNVQRVLSLFTKNLNFRLAHPGEFTYRALRNKKLSLAEVEGLDLFLNATSNLLLDQGQSLMQGKLKEHYQALHASFVTLKASIELSIDFAEDVGADEIKNNIESKLNEFSNLINKLYNKTQLNIASLIAPEIVLIGNTNAGKSSLFNAILIDNRSIVSSIAGTTRDYITENIFYDQIHFKLVDTAGMRISNDEIEKEGISRAYKLIKNAFYKILVVNPYQWDLKQLPIGEIELDAIVVTHADVSDFAKAYEKIKKELPKARETFVVSLGPIGPASQNGPIGPSDFSGPIGPQKLILDNVVAKFQRASADEPILIQRHAAVIKMIKNSVDEFTQLLKRESDVGIISSEINNIGHHIHELIGIVTPDEVLNSIFKNFCIGK
ncbi:MAG: GTPase [Bacteriovoracaceae bacterium]